MVDAIVSVVLEQLISVVIEEGKERMRLVTGVLEQVQKLTSNFRAIQAVLSDAEKRQVQEESVRNWLDQLKDATYAMEDVLEEWETARLKLKLGGDGDSDASVKVCSLLPAAAASCFGFTPVVARRDIALKIKEINETLEDIHKQKDLFHFDVNVIKTTGQRADQRPPTISEIDESEIFGRENEKNELIAKVLRQTSSIISLVGMGGIGKTTLAQFVYNNGDVQRNFHHRIWVSVSEPFDELRIARAIIEALEGSASNLVEFNSLIGHIKNLVARKKLLLVLDDVWNDDFFKWEQFYNCLRYSLPGSKVLITTRKEIVARNMRSNDIISINVLSEMECLSVFESLAFSTKSMGDHQNLGKIGHQIVKKCKGLPLAAKTIGCLLLSKDSEQEWESVLQSEMWEKEEVERGLLAPLLLSYNDLPSKLKQCFTYCAVFPKDYSLRKDELVALWMAQGYLNDKANKDMEVTGEEYFNILASRSFFQDFWRSDNGEIVSCKMHDIVHDFAQFLCRNECLATEIHSEKSVINSFPGTKVRHLMLTVNPLAVFHVSLHKLEGLRSLLIEDRSNHSRASEVLPELFDKLTCLRALILPTDAFSIKFDDKIFIPENIKNLLHLRYLNLTGQKVKKLPDSLCELYYLERLDVTGCAKLRELPQGIGKLRKLMYLLNAGTDKLRYLPEGIGGLTSLRRVDKFILGSGDGGSRSSSSSTLESLQNLNLLRRCSVHGLGGVSDVGDATRSQLDRKKNLSELVFDFDQFSKKDGGGSRGDAADEQILEALQPPPNLKELEICGYRGKSIPPNWTLSSSLPNLKKLCLHFCNNVEHLPPLGKLPFLESLDIVGMPSVKRLGSEFLGIETDTSDAGAGVGSGSTVNSIVAGAFPKLESFIIDRMDGLVEWDYGSGVKGDEESVMPCLSYLHICSCPRLGSLPDHLLQNAALRRLYTWECPILRERYRKQTGEDWPKIRHIPDIILN